jgi:DNA-binding CsgD family transcriptional regulator
METHAELQLGRECYRRRLWREAYERLSGADEVTSLDAEDLELLAMSAYLVGLDDEYLHALERAHHAHVDGAASARAARCAFWLGLRLLFRGEPGRAMGWLGRAQRLIEHEPRPCVEAGYLLVTVVQQQIDAGDRDAAYVTAASAAESAERFGDADLLAIARHLQGLVRVKQARVKEGLALLDEAMLAATAGELSPLVTGLIYCSVIEGCQEVYALGRAREWTAALAQWCEGQPEMVAFSGVCRVHRAEIMQLQGFWLDALEEAKRAVERAPHMNRQATAAAFYQQAEVHRLRGDLAEAEETYRRVSDLGADPQPGLALLRAAQGRAEVAAAAIRRAMGALTDPLPRSRLLPAFVEIMLSIGDAREAHVACRELEEIASTFGTDVLGAMAAHARGSVELADGKAQTALAPLRRARELWQSVEAPYPSARVRVLTGLACKALGDSDGYRLELEAARAVFERLGAASELARIDSRAEENPPAPSHGLTPRELEVLRLVAAGKTNKAIAAALSLSEKTVDKHVSNVLFKLDVHSRAAATAYAYQRRLVGLV